MTRYWIHIYFNDGRRTRISGDYCNDWAAQEAALARFPDARLIVPHRIGRLNG